MATPTTTMAHRIPIDGPWLQHLQNNGYVVISNVASSADVKHARSLLWDAIEETYSSQGVYRSDMASWNDWPLDRRGFMQSGKITQSRGAWFLRGLPVLRSAFARIWGVNIESEKDALVCSMDSVIAWRPWDGANHPWCPQTEGLHIDQNPHTKRDFCCVQGMLPLYDVTEQSGGLEVVPGSHLEQERHKKNCSGGTANWVMIPPNLYTKKQRYLVSAFEGDLILWDSRTVHGGVVGTGFGRAKSADTAENYEGSVSVTTMMPSGAPSSVIASTDFSTDSIGLEKEECLHLEENCLDACSTIQSVKGHPQDKRDSQVQKEAFTYGCQNFGAVTECPKMKGVEVPEYEKQLARLSMTVCMTPRKWASDETLAARKRVFRKGGTMSHWPHEGHITRESAGPLYAPIQLNQWEEALL